MRFERGGAQGMLQVRYVARYLKRREAEVTPSTSSGQALARFAGEGRGEGSHALLPRYCPLTLTPTKTWWRGDFFFAFEPTRTETPRLRGENKLPRQSGLFGNPQHKVQILNRHSGGAFAEVIEAGH